MLKLPFYQYIYIYQALWYRFFIGMSIKTDWHVIMLHRPQQQSRSNQTHVYFSAIIRWFSLIFLRKKKTKRMIFNVIDMINILHITMRKNQKWRFLHKKHLFYISTILVEILCNGWPKMVIDSNRFVKKASSNCVYTFNNIFVLHKKRRSAHVYSSNNRKEIQSI